MIFEKGIFSSAYAGSVRYYAAMMACRKAVVHTGERKRKMPWSINHCNLIGANGEQTLTLPVVKNFENGVPALNNIEISEHGDWRRTHWGAVFSAYGKSPFFEYVADDLSAIYDNKNLTNLSDFNLAIHNLVVDFLDLPLNVDFLNELPVEKDDYIDFRGKPGCSKADGLDFIQDVPYWQVWSERHGFKSDLSIIDLLMTHGRESIFVLRRMLGK